MEASTDLFINLIQSNRILYDKSLKDFKNTRKKEEIWQQVADQSRMSVDAAKKRYSSLRQKYCREKRNIEVKRRNKCATKRYWVYFERLHFLDSFIQPRSTYTNDTLFEEDSDEHIDESVGLNQSASNIDIQLEDGIEINELDDCYIKTEDADNAAQEHLNQVEMSENGKEDCNSQQQDEIFYNNSERLVVELVESEYTGEVSTFVYTNSPVRNDAPNSQQNNDSTRDTQVTATEERAEDPVDMDEYVSSRPSTSSSKMSQPLRRTYPTATGKTSARDNSTSAENRSSFTVNVTDEEFDDSIDVGNHISRQPGTSASQTAILTSHRNNPKNISTRDESMAKTVSRQSAKQMPSNTSKPNDSRPSLPHQSRVDLSAPKKAAVKRTGVNCTDMSTASAMATTTSKDQRIEAIRQRMESCLTAITNKVTEKSQRSPHAPFLAYLGTKLAMVPNEILPNLEREILDLVAHHSI